MEPIDYERVLTDLEAKRAAFNDAVDAAIGGIRHVLAAMAGNPTQPGTTSRTQPTANAQTTLTPDAFFGLGIGEAAIKYLSVTKRQQRSREIADALEAAGYHHNSTNFTNTVNTALYRRSKDEQDVVRIGRNWALAEWYPRRKATGSKRQNLNEPEFAEVPSAESDDDTVDDGSQEH